MHAGPSRRAALLAGLSVCALPSLPAHSEAGWTPLQKIGARMQRSALRTVESEYSTEFSAYLARILITWEPVTRRFWEDRQREGGAFEMDARVYGRARELGTERREEYLASRFSSLVTSVEVGLTEFGGRQGASRLAASLATRYTSVPQKRALAQLLSMVEPLQQQPAHPHLPPEAGSRCLRPGGELRCRRSRSPAVAPVEILRGDDRSTLEVTAVSRLAVDAAVSSGSNVRGVFGFYAACHRGQFGRQTPTSKVFFSNLKRKPRNPRPCWAIRPVSVSTPVPIRAAQSFSLGAKSKQNLWY